MISALKKIYLKTIRYIPAVHRAVCFCSVYIKGIGEIELQPGKLNIICSSHIGEIYYVCVLSDIINKAYDKKINLIISESYKDMSYFFQSENLQISTCQNIVMKRLARLSDDAMFFLKKYREYDIVIDNTNKRKEYYVMRGVNIIDLIPPHYNVQDCEKERVKPFFTNKISENNRNRLLELGLEQGKTILIFPEAKSCPGFNVDEWLGLAERIVNSGYKVCFNTKDESYARFPMIFWGIRETIEAIWYCGTVISLRSGMCDLIQDMDVKKIVIYPKLYYNVTRKVSYFDVYNLKWANGIIEMEVNNLDKINID